MTTTKRRYLLTALVSLLGATAAIPVIVSGTASAQENSRICGRGWSTDNNSKYREKIYRVYEVPKEGSAECDWARSSSNHSENPLQFPNTDEKVGSWWVTWAIGQITCEEFVELLVKDPNWEDKTKKRDIYFVGGGFPDENKDDLCQSMNRSDTRATMRRYWAYLHDFNAQPDDMPWHFYRD